jgi:3',5'-cyclic AMP phosphodiesterase CpdA
MGEGCMNAPSEFQRGYDYGNSFYSFDAAMVHVVVLNPYTSSNASSAQYRWLEADLLSIDRELTPWVVVMMHTPWYSSNKRHHNEWQTVAMREAMEALLYKYDVNLVLSGHVHAYERTYPVYRAVVRHDGIVYLTVGTGGNTGEHHSEFFDQPKWSAARDGTHFGYGQLNFLTRDQLLWTWHRNEDETNTAADEVIICNKYFTGSADCYYSIWRLPMYIADIPLLVGMLTVVVLVILIIIFKCNGMDLFPPPSGTQPRDSHATDRYSKYYSSVHAASVCAEESKPLLRGP